MNVSCGIVGLPNVGKSTLFNALLKRQQALAANYPFATIEPNIGVVVVPDIRLNNLAEITKEEEKMSQLPSVKPAIVEFVDIAGLVKGASEGEGLGNKFLSHIREVRVIAHVVRAFTDENVIREGSVDVKSDYETINTELILADLGSIKKALDNRKIESAKKLALEKVAKSLERGIPARLIDLNEEEQEELKEYFLLSAKPEIIVLNVAESDYNPEKLEKITKEYSEILQLSSEFKDNGGEKVVSTQASRNDTSNIIVISAQIESDLAALSDDEQKEYLKGLGLEESGLERLIKKAYFTLGLISFLTAGEKEVKAWTIKKGISAQMAAGEIHTDFIKKFIRAEIVSYQDFVEYSGWKGSRENGKARLEGKDYIMKDGDVVEFKIGA